jgi:AmmeMemoRadiSam system protein B
MWAARELGADTIKVLRHATSGNVTGDYSSVVGYGAAAILKGKTPKA